MANVFAPFGFSQYRGNGSSPTYELVTRQIGTSAGAIYSGDPVTSQSDGTIAQSSASPGTTQIAGIFYGCTFLSAALNRTVWSPYWPGSGSAVSGSIVTGYIVNDPNANFLVQVGGSTTPIGLSNIGENIQLAIGTGNALSGISGAYANQTVTSPSTTTLPFRIVNLVTNPPGANGTDSTTGYNYIVVAFNNVDTRVLTGQ